MSLDSKNGKYGLA